MLSRFQVVRSARSLSALNYNTFFKIRAISSFPGRSKWNSLTANEKMAWQELGWSQASWEGKDIAPASAAHNWKKLTLSQQSAVQFGLSMSEQKWEQLIANSSLQQPIAASTNSGFQMVDAADSATTTTTTKKSQPAVVKESKSKSSFGGALVGALWTVVKTAAPLVKAIPASHPGAKLAASLFTQLPSIVEEFSPPVVVTGVETLLYLDDSGSMSNKLYQGQRVLEQITPLLSHNTRIVKFGTSKTLLSARDDKISSSLTMLGWNATSGSTYMWKMIEDDVMQRYRPGNGKLRIVIITDGADTESPNEYHGMRGMDPMMKVLLSKRFDIEWHIILVGDVGKGMFSDFSLADVKRYESLAAATGGGFLVVPQHGYNDKSPETQRFLEVLEESGDQSEQAQERRRNRKLLYGNKSKTGKMENFDWIKLLP